MEKSSASAAVRHEQQSAVKNRSRSSTNSSLAYHRPQVVFDNQNMCVCLGFALNTLLNDKVQTYQEQR